MGSVWRLGGGDLKGEDLLDSEVLRGEDAVEAFEREGTLLVEEVGDVSSTGTALQVDAGMAPPAGGGFEVRRRDGDFGPGVDQDLVLRNPVRSFSIPREGQVEHYYVRMYDGSTPPVYSRFSSAVFTDLPVS